MNPKEGLTRREFIGAVTGLGALLAACSRPGRPDPGIELPTPLPAITVPAKTPELPKTPTPKPTVTETPKPVEKDVLGEWRFTPVIVKEEAETPGFRPPIREGYKRLSFLLAVQNLSTDLRNLNTWSDHDVGFILQAAGGFRYPQGDFATSEILSKVPPGYTLPFGVSYIDVPLTAKDLKLVANWTKPTKGNTQIIWDLEKDFPPLGQERKIEYRSPDKKGLKQLGETLEQGPLRITPLKAVLSTTCDAMNNRGSWYMGLQFQVENRYGYDLRPLAEFRVFDKDGRGYTIKGDLPIPEIPPEMTKIFFGTGSVSPDVKTLEKSFLVCELPADFPPPPNELVLMALLSIFQGPYAYAEETWALYDLGKPPIIPRDPKYGAYGTIKNYFSGK